MGGYGAAGVYGTRGGILSMGARYNKGYGGGYGGYGGYGSSSKKRKNKQVFKILLAMLIATVVWSVCLQ
jgi:hypothetical protein